MAAERRLVAGLGNPGKDYARTRHNIGFMVIDFLAARRSLTIDKKKFEVAYNSTDIKGEKLLFAKPMTYMNNSGYSLLKLARYFNADDERMVVIHDDIDLAFGQIKIKTQGGHGGHNGIKSLIDAFGRNDFTRIRVGIGHPGNKNNVVDHVLGSFSQNEAGYLDQLIERTVEAAITVLEKGNREAMNLFHGSRP